MSGATAESDPLGTAWERASESGSYRFRSDLAQTTTPVASVTNVGRSATVDQLYIDGTADVAGARLEMRAWASGGMVAGGVPDAEFRMSDGLAEQRAAGGEWVETADVGVVAPGGDTLAYVAAARDVVELGTEVVAGRVVTKYSFSLDGSAFARLVAEQTEDVLRRRGELAPGGRVQPSAFYRDTVGSGEVWIDDAGLPVRQVLSLRFPAQADDVVTAEVTTDFFGFGDGGGNGWWSSATDTSTWLLVMAGFGGVWMLVLVADRRRVLVRPVAVTVSATLFVTLLVGPGSAVAGAPESRAARVATADSARILDERDLFAALNARLAAPNESLLAPVLAFTGADDETDTDDDGLTDFVELRIGTTVDDADTDGDGISDADEVNGFEYRGNQWYGDPFQVDSNGDTIADGREWDADENGTPDDRDDDGIPDLFDDDNDGDGVPDHVDVSPFGALPTMWGANLPMGFSVDSALVMSDQEYPNWSRLPLSVDFQLRPRSQDHLQFALQPMDWPSDDEGQIRDVNDAPGQDDFQLIPNLEIIVPDASHVLPSDEVLGRYLINVSDLGEGQRAAYVPLNLVTDPRSGQRVAFSGQMPYLSQDAWGPDHEVRLVWMVQMNNDVVCDPAADDAPAECDADGYALDQPQIVHRYYDDWTLTGLKVAQEHGSGMATIHQNRSVSSADAPTWILADVLGQRFLSATENGSAAPEREITLDTLAAQLDRDLIGVGQPEAAYGLPNVFEVDAGEYSTLSEAVNDFGANRVPALLETKFEPFWTGPDSVRPLVMTVYETRSREATLDQVIDLDGIVSASSTAVAVDLNPPSGPASVMAFAGMRWTYYCGGQGTAPVWSACDTELVWERLDDEFGDVLFNPNFDEPEVVVQLDDDDAAAQNLAMQLFAITMSTGTSRLVSFDDGTGVPTVPVIDDTTDEQTLTDEVRKSTEFAAANGARAGAKFVANKIFFGQLTKAYPIVKKLAGFGAVSAAKDFGKGVWAKGLGGKTALGLGLAVAVVGAAVLVAFAASGDAGAVIGVKAAIISGQLLFGVIGPIYTLVKVTKTLGTAVRLSQMSSTLIGSTRVAGLIGLVISVGLAWGAFIAGVVNGGAAFYSPEWNSAFADTIASTMLAVFLFVIATNPIGLIIVGVVAVLDGILSLICEAGGVDTGTDLTDEGCFTLTGAATKVLSAALYGYELMVDVEADDLVDLGDVDVSLRDESAGYQVDNQIDVVFGDVVTTVSHQAPSPETWQIIPYLWFYSKGNLRSSTMEYTLETFEEELDSEWDSMPQVWAPPTVHDEYLDKDLYTTSKTEELAVVLDLDTAGVNRSFDVYLNNGYAFPSAECWTVPIPFGIPPVIPVCYKRSFFDNDSTAFDPRVYDVFPATLGEFIAIDSRPGGARGLKWDVAFPALPDADFDGLRSSAFGGLDPDDSRWDTDRDGLGDAYEMEQRAAGLALDLGFFDTDADGLTDAQEFRLGTDPGRRDTDNDGLDDGDEVHHLVYEVQGSDGLGWNGTLEGGWDVTVYTDIVDGDDGWEVTESPGDVTVQVSSDPLSADGDGDGIGDQAERQLAQSGALADRIDANGAPFHPNVFNVSPVVVALSLVGNTSGYVRPGDELSVVTDVTTTAALAPGAVAYVGSPVFDVVPDPARLDFDPGSFDRSQTMSSTSSWTVGANATNGAADIEANAVVRLPGTAPEPPTWSVMLESPLSRTDLLNRIALTPRTDEATTFTLADVGLDAVAIDAMTEVGGDVRNQTIPGLTTSTLDVDQEQSGPMRNDFAYLRGQGGTDVACTDDGFCMTVWDQYDNCSSFRVLGLTGGDIEQVDGDEMLRVFLELSHLDGQGGSVVGDTEYVDLDTFVDLQSRGPYSWIDFCGDIRLDVFDLDGATRQDYYWGSTGSVLGAASISASEVNTGQASYRLGNFNYTDSFDCGTSFADCSDLFIVLEYGEERSRARVAGAVTNTNGLPAVTQPQFQIPAAVGVVDERPVIASDGTGFAMAWLRTENGQRTLMSAEFDASGALISMESRYRIPGSWPVDVAIAWIGDQYLIAVNDSSPDILDDQGIGLIYPSMPVGPSAVGPAELSLAADPEWTPLFGGGGLSVAYDPITDRTAVAYMTIDGEIDVAVFEDLGEAVGVPTAVASRIISTQDKYPRIAFNALTGGWLVGARTGSLFLSEGVTWSADSLLTSVVRSDTAEPAVRSDTAEPSGGFAVDSAVACPAWTSVPFADLRLEELPGTSEFVDASRFGHDAVVSGSVTAAVSGTSRAGSSDFAVRFDGIDDELSMPVADLESSTVTFWYRTQVAAPDEEEIIYIPGGVLIRTWSPVALEVGSGLQGVPVQIHADGSVSIEAPGYGTQQQESVLGDFNWHMVTVTREPTGSDWRLVVYVDGQRLPTTFYANDDVPLDDSFDLVGGTSVVDVDHVRVFATSLGAERAAAIAAGTDSSYCVSALAGYTGGESQVPFARHFFDEVDPRGGRIDASARLGLVVDNDLPTSTVQLPVGVIANPGGAATTVVIGGSASDATSGIARVEVRVNNGAWQVATGAEAWSFPVSVTSGWYTVEVRAVDQAGNEQFVSVPQEFEVDGYTPFVLLDAVPGVVRPATDPVSGARSLALSGSVLDVEPSSGLDRVEVQLTPSGSVPGEDGWQPSTVSGGEWSVDYGFSADAPEPVGDFVVRVRAVDVAGNVYEVSDSVVVDGAAPQVAVDGIDDVVTGSVVVRGDVFDTGAAGVGSVEVSLTPLSDVVGQVEPDWQPASVDGSRWSYPVPAGVEDIVQVDVRVVDTVGNERVETNLWRGIVDNLAPRVSRTVEATGRENARQMGSQYVVVCSVEDRFLVEGSFECPGAVWREPTRTFVSDAAIDALFPDLVGVSGLRSEFAVWSSSVPSGVVSACDAYGNCSSGSATLAAPTSVLAGSSAAVRPLAVNPTRVVVTSPGGGIEVRGLVTVGFDAVTDDSFDRVEVLVDGAVVSTRSFATGESSLYEASIAVPSVVAGERSVAVRVTTHDGQDVSSDPVVFVYDPTPPVVTIDSTELDSSDSWGQGTNVYRLSGTVSDDATLQAVQVRVGDGPWVDAFFDAGVWSLAVQIPDADGAGFSVSVRATDRAGNVSVVDESGAVDLSPVVGFVRPDTVIDACVGCVTQAPSVTFELSSIVGSNDVSSFECELDGLPAVGCSSPWTVTGLATGQHSLTVTAIDDGGFRDLTPALASWRVAASGPQAAITTAPSDPSDDRTATFVFSGVAGAVFGCSMDGEPFVVCSSPWVVDGLGYGEHEFRVRATSGGVTGTPVAHRWSIVNAAPVAFDQTVFTTMDESVDVTLFADDADELSFRVVEAPRFGTLEGVAPDVVYVPFDGYVGFDSFTFEADDSQETSRAATVNVVVGTTDPPGVTVTAASTDPTNVNPLVFDIRFDQVMTGFGIDDVVVAGSAGLEDATVELFEVVPFREWTLVIDGVTGTGTVEVSVKAGAARNATLQRNPVSNTAVVVFDEDGPIVTITPVAGQSFLVGTGPFWFEVVFNEPVSGLTIDDFRIGGTAGIVSATLSGSGGSYVLTVPDSEVAGTITIELIDGAVVDQLGNVYTARATAQLIGGILPATGNGPLPIGVAILLIGLGLALVAASRRRTTTA